MPEDLRSTDLPPSALIDEVLGNRDGGTVRQGVSDLGTQLLGSGPVAAALTALEGQITSGIVSPAAWAGLELLTGLTDRAGAEVPDTDTGTHLQATATGYDGPVVPNGGRYTWYADWGRWFRIGNTGLAGKANAADLSPVATSGDYDDLTNLPTFGTAAATDADAYATAAQGGKADTAVQPGALTHLRSREADRPETPEYFSDTAVGPNRDQIATGAAAVSDLLGAVWRLDGADAVGGQQDIASRTEFAVAPGRVYEARFVVARAVDPVDPSGHAIEARIQNLNKNRASVSGALLQTVLGGVADGVQSVSMRYSLDAGCDYQCPASTRYAVPYLRLYGADHQTDIAAISVDDVTGLVAEETARAALDTSLAEVATTGDSDDLTEGATQLLMTPAERATVGHLNVSAATDLDVIRARVDDLDAAVVLRGSWSAAGGAFPGGGAAGAGSAWIVSAAGTVDGIDFAVNDRIIALTDGASATTYAGQWVKADYTDQVLSVAGRQGAVDLTASDVGLEQVNNTADTDKPVSTAQQAALDALEDREITARSGAGLIIFDSVGDGKVTVTRGPANGLTLLWPELEGRLPSGTVTIAALLSTVLLPGECLSIDLTGPSPYVVTKSVGDFVLYADHLAGRKAILVHMKKNAVGGVMGHMVQRALDNAARILAEDQAASDLAAVDAATYKTTAQPLSATPDLQFLAPPGWNRGLAPLGVNVGTSYFQYQTERGAGTVRIDNVNSTLDLEYLEPGASVTVIAPSGGKVFLHADPIGMTGNRATLGATDVIRIRQLGTRAIPLFLVETLAGAPVWADVTRPAMDQTLALAGQSQWTIGHKAGSIGGFCDRLLDRFVASYPSTYFVDGATGGSSITGSTGWWNNGAPGAALVRLLDGLDAAVAAGQPPATETLWRQGEADITALQTGAMTTAIYKANVQAVFDHIRAHDGGTYSGMQFICSGPQAQDSDTEFGGAMAARTAYIELAEALSYVHRDTGWYDVPRQEGNVHPYNGGYWAMGYRTATAWLIQQGETRDPGPQIGTVTLGAEGKTISVVITGESRDIVIPWGSRGHGEDLGPYPFGWCAIAGDPRTAAPIPLKTGSIVASGTRQVTLTLTSNTDLTGARLYTWNGNSADSRRRNYIRNDFVHGPSLGYPMRDQRTGVLA